MYSSLADDTVLSPGPAGRNSLMRIRPCSNSSAGNAVDAIGANDTEKRKIKRKREHFMVVSVEKIR
jgi:hypothetical protein